MMQRWMSCSMDFKEEIKMLNEFEITMAEALKPFVNRILTLYADAIRANDGVINDHDGNLEKVSGLIITARKETCPVIQGTAGYINPVYLKDEIPHWSTFPCAGPYFAWHNNEDLEHAVTRTNRALVKSGNTIYSPIIGFIELKEEENHG